jgi:glycosyltransferase involved in cell wall biosynthesis
MFKVLHVVAALDPAMGGVTEAVHFLVRALNQQGIHNEVATLDDPDAAYLLNLKDFTHALGPGKGPWRRNRKLLSWLLLHLPDYDAVVVHGIWLYHSYAVNKAAKQLRQARLKNSEINSPLPKITIMPHGMLDPYFQQAPGRRIKAVRNAIYWRFIEHQAVNAADSQFFACEQERQLARQAFPSYSPRREVVAGLGIAEPPPHCAEMSAAFLTACPAIGKSSYLLFLGRIDRKKGLDLLLRAYAAVAREYSEIQGININRECATCSLPKLVIAGPCVDEAYKTYLLNLMNKDVLLRTSVLFTGMLTSYRKWGALYGCEALVLPSHQENFGISVVEALACSKPVLISTKVNIWREIIEGGAGIAAFDSLQGITELIASWVTTPDRRRSAMSQAAVDVFRSHFTTAQVAGRMLNVMLDRPL